MSKSPDISVLPSTDETPNGRHRSGRRLHRGAAAVTAFVAVGAVAMAAYAGMPTGKTLNADGLTNTLSDASPFVGEATLGFVAKESKSPLAASLATLETQVSGSSLKSSTWSTNKARTAAGERSEQIAAERAEEAAAQKAAEQAAAQKAAEEAAAEQAAAQEAAAAEREQAASRSEEREVAAPAPEAPKEAAPAPEPAPEPEPAPAPAPPSGSPRTIAQNMLGNYGWGQDQWGCLDSLWMRESGWNTYAENPSSGAYGIPQSLPGSKMATAGSDWRTNPATQISWGLSYISGRYGTPCGAWAHSESVGWY